MIPISLLSGPLQCYIKESAIYKKIWAKSVECDCDMVLDGL